MAYPYTGRVETGLPAPGAQPLDPQKALELAKMLAGAAYSVPGAMGERVGRRGAELMAEPPAIGHAMQPMIGAAPEMMGPPPTLAQMLQSGGPAGTMQFPHTGASIPLDKEGQALQRRAGMDVLMEVISAGTMPMLAGVIRKVPDHLIPEVMRQLRHGYTTGAIDAERVREVVDIIEGTGGQITRPPAARWVDPSPLHPATSKESMAASQYITGPGALSYEGGPMTNLANLPGDVAQEQLRQQRFLADNPHLAGTRADPTAGTPHLAGRLAEDVIEGGIGGVRQGAGGGLHNVAGETGAAGFHAAPQSAPPPRINEGVREEAGNLMAMMRTKEGAAGNLIFDPKRTLSYDKLIEAYSRATKLGYDPGLEDLGGHLEDMRRFAEMSKAPHTGPNYFNMPHHKLTRGIEMLGKKRRELNSALKKMKKAVGSPEDMNPKQRATWDEKVAQHEKVTDQYRRVLKAQEGRNLQEYFHAALSDRLRGIQKTMAPAAGGREYEEVASAMSRFGDDPPFPGQPGYEPQYPGDPRDKSGAPYPIAQGEAYWEAGPLGSGLLSGQERRGGYFPVAPSGRWSAPGHLGEGQKVITPTPALAVPHRGPSSEMRPGLEPKAGPSYRLSPVGSTAGWRTGTTLGDAHFKGGPSVYTPTGTVAEPFIATGPLGWRETGMPQARSDVPDFPPPQSWYEAQAATSGVARALASGQMSMTPGKEGGYFDIMRNLAHENAQRGLIGPEEYQDAMTRIHAEELRATHIGRTEPLVRSQAEIELLAEDVKRSLAVGTVKPKDAEKRLDDLRAEYRAAGYSRK